MPFPESVAAAESTRRDKAGAKAQSISSITSPSARRYSSAGAFGCYAPDQDYFFRIGQLGRSTLRLGPLGSTQTLATGGVTTVAAPTVSPAYIGVGYIIGPELAALNFSGSVVAWGVLIPLFIYFLGPQFRASCRPSASDERLARTRRQPSGATSCVRSRWAA